MISMGIRCRLAAREPSIVCYFFLSLDCPICKSLLPVVQSVAAAEQVELIFISDGARLEDHRRFAHSHGLESYRYVLSEAVGMAYAVGKLPYAVLVAPGGTIISLGIVNNREHLESLFTAKDIGGYGSAICRRARAAAKLVL